jgi:hypothetical protein
VIQLLAVLPRPLEGRALEVAKEVSPSKHVVGDPKLLALRLESCLSHAEERDGAVFCVSDLLSHVPPAVVKKAVELGEAHPAFDWEDAHAEAVHDSSVFNSCVESAGTVGEGVVCLGAFMAALPDAMVERSVRIDSELPAPHQAAEEPEMLSKDLVYCLQLAEKRDAAQYCLAHFLGGLPDEQVHEAYLYSKTHRFKGAPFLTDYKPEDEAIIADTDGASSNGEAGPLPGLAFGRRRGGEDSVLYPHEHGEESFKHEVATWNKQGRSKGARSRHLSRMAHKDMRKGEAGRLLAAKSRGREGRGRGMGERLTRARRAVLEEEERLRRSAARAPVSGERRRDAEVKKQGEALRKEVEARLARRGRWRYKG